MTDYAASAARFARDTAAHSTIPGFLATLTGGDLPADAVREERCLRGPIGCGKPLIAADGTTRVFWDEAEAARYKAEWEITGLCPDCQDRVEMTGCPGFEDNPVVPNLCAGCHKPREGHAEATR